MVLLAQATSTKPNYAAMVTVLRELPELLEAGRSKHGITTTVQANQMGVALSTLSNLYRGKGVPNLTTIVAALSWLARS